MIFKITVNMHNYYEEIHILVNLKNKYLCILANCLLITFKLYLKVVFKFNLNNEQVNVREKCTKHCE